MSAGPTGGAAPRLLALDLFRGATVAAMILVNNPGSWGAIYAPLKHAAWHGWTPTDLIFPFFLFIVGVAIPLALGRRRAAGVARGPLCTKAFVRGLVIVGIGLGLNAYPKLVPLALLGLGEQGLAETWSGLRLPGVLQRIGICYTIGSLLFLFASPRALKLTAAALLLGYWALMTLVPVPGIGAPDLASRSAHLAGWLDRTLLGEGHLWSSAKVYDPEGLLSTLPAIATVLFGIFAGQTIRRPNTGLEQRILALFVTGTALAAVGQAWDYAFPINKPLWTSSYALFTAGLAGQALALCLYVCDLRGWRRFAEPFRVYGMNAITVFAGSALLVKTLVWIEVGDGTGGRIALRTWIYRNLFESWLDGAPASLAYALAWVAGWYLVLAWMDRRGLYLKV
jgi:predicted acyltransferase